MNKRFVYFILCLLIFAFMRFGFRYMATDDLQFLLLPTQCGIESITGTNSVYDRQTGYFFPSINIVIDKSCSGYNFMLTCFLLITFVLFRSSRIKAVFVPFISAIASYFITILANISRISIYVLLKNNIPEFLKFDGLHQTEGIFVYLSFLITTYFLLSFLLNKLHYPNENIA